MFELTAGVEDRGVKLGCNFARTRADEEGTAEQWSLTPFSTPRRNEGQVSILLV